MPSNLSIRIIGDCDQGIIDQFTFYGGESRTLKFQIYDATDEQRICIDAAAVKTLYLPSVDSVDIEILDAAITADPDCDSVFSVDLTDTHTDKLMTGWMRFQYAVGGVVRIAYADFVIKKLIA